MKVLHWKPVLVLAVLVALATGCGRGEQSGPRSAATDEVMGSGAATGSTPTDLDSAITEDRVPSSFSLPPGEHRETVVANCTLCHSAALILQHRMTRAEWDATITWMQETQNLRQFEPDIRSDILDYLAAHFGREAAADSSGEPLYLPNPVW